MSPVKLADVAERAGVSVSTVSRVLSKARPVGKETEMRVRRAAAELGYSGNSIARALRKKRTDTVGMLVPSILNPFFVSLVNSMENALHAEGKQLLLCDSRQDPVVEAEHLRSLVDRHVDGIVVSPCDAVASIDAIRTTARAVPLVQLDRRVDLENSDWIGVDDGEAMRLVLSYLAATGVRSAAFVTSELTNSSTSLRLHGFQQHASRLGIETRDEWLVFRDYSVESGELAARLLLTPGARPDAIVCADDLIAIGVLRACRELGIAVPGDVQVTGFDDITFAAYVTPALTSLAQPTERMAFEALRLLSQQTTVGQPVTGSGTRLSFSPTLVIRDSTRPAPAAAS